MIETQNGHTFTSAAQVAWWLLHGADRCGRKEGAGNRSGIIDRTFHPDPREFEFTVTDDGSLGWVHTPTGEKVAGEFWVPALLPDGYLICTVNTEHTEKHPHGYLATGVVRYGEEAKVAELLRKEGVEISGDGSLVADLLRSIGCSALAVNNNFTKTAPSEH